MKDNKRKEYLKAYYKANKEKIKASAKKRNDENKESIKEYQKKYKENNKDTVNEKRKEYLKNYYQENKEHIKSKVKEFYNENKEQIKEYQKEYRNDYFKDRRKQDNLFRLKQNIRNIIGYSIKKSEFKKLSRTEQILGCSYNDFKLYIENQFNEFMSWENYGLYNGEFNHGWDIDHIIPLSSATNEIELLKLNHYTNLQPLCSKINRDIKKDKLSY